MILEMKVPSPGESISEVEIAQWLVSDGDYVEKDQTIAEVDSDKATLDLPAEESGIITLKANEGDTVVLSKEGKAWHCQTYLHGTHLAAYIVKEIVTSSNGVQYILKHYRLATPITVPKRSMLCKQATTA